MTVKRAGFGGMNGVPYYFVNGCSKPKVLLYFDAALVIDLLQW